MNKFIAFTLLIASFSSYGAMLGEERDWTFVKSVGGIEIGKPKNINKEWLLPIRCDVSGLTTITSKPSVVNSALVLADTKIKIRENNIYITIETGLINVSGKSTHCSSVKLGKLNPGNYKVKYLSPNGELNDLRSIEIEL